MATSSPPTSIEKKLLAETVGTALLLAVVVGSGIMGERLAAGNVAIALLANTAATGAALVALILAFGPVSGAHFNPAVTLVDAWRHGISWRYVPGYVSAQFVGALTGVAAAHLMFGEPVYSLSTHSRSGGAQAFSEFVATFGLMAEIWGVAAHPPLGNSVRGGGLHQRRLLVHRLHVLCQSRRHRGPLPDKYFFWNSPGGHSGLHRGPIAGSVRGGCSFYE